jgi:hypothetical protein
MDLIWYDMIYFLTSIGLTPGDSGTVHIYTQTIHRTTQQQLVTRHSEDSDRSKIRHVTDLILM